MDTDMDRENEGAMTLQLLLDLEQQFRDEAMKIEAMLPDRGVVPNRAPGREWRVEQLRRDADQLASVREALEQKLAALPRYTSRMMADWSGTPYEREMILAVDLKAALGAKESR